MGRKMGTQVSISPFLRVASAHSCPPSRQRGRDFDGYGSSRWPHHFGKHFGRRGPRFFPFFFLSIPFLFCVPFFFPAFIFLLAAPFMFIMSIPMIMLHFFLDILFWIF